MKNENAYCCDRDEYFYRHNQQHVDSLRRCVPLHSSVKSLMSLLLSHFKETAVFSRSLTLKELRVSLSSAGRLSLVFTEYTTAQNLKQSGGSSWCRPAWGIHFCGNTCGHSYISNKWAPTCSNSLIRDETYWLFYRGATKWWGLMQEALLQDKFALKWHVRVKDVRWEQKSSPDTLISHGLIIFT